MASKPSASKVPIANTADEQKAGQRQPMTDEEREELFESCRIARERSRQLKEKKAQRAAELAFFQAQQLQIAMANAAGYMGPKTAQTVPFQHPFGPPQGFPAPQAMPTFPAGNSAPACPGGPFPGPSISGQPTGMPGPTPHQFNLNSHANVHVNGDMYSYQPQNLMPTSVGMSAPSTHVQQQQIPYGFPFQGGVRPPFYQQALDTEIPIQTEAQQSMYHLPTGAEQPVYQPTTPNEILLSTEGLNNGIPLPNGTQQPLYHSTTPDETLLSTEGLYNGTPSTGAQQSMYKPRTPDEIPECLAVLGLTEGQVKCYCAKCTEAEFLNLD